MATAPHILICDDDPVVHESLGLYFENEHFTYSSAYDGRDALAHVASDKPDLIILDVMMPEKTGIEVCREIRKTLSTPIIILTAKGEEIDRVLGLELGADDYIVKPFSPREVIARIKAATSHLSGLKIAIMGCIVNGPGEMADADYGYVGAARGKVSLYKQKQCIEMNIPEEEAVDRLLQFIEEDQQKMKKEILVNQ